MEIFNLEKRYNVYTGEFQKMEQVYSGLFYSDITGEKIIETPYEYRLFDNGNDWGGYYNDKMKELSEKYDIDYRYFYDAPFHWENKITLSEMIYDDTSTLLDVLIMNRLDNFEKIVEKEGKNRVVNEMYLH